jgi:hypothetical protein
MIDLIRKGQRVLVTTGEYSDYSIRMVAEALDDIHVFTLREEWLVLHPDQREDYHFQEEPFLAWVYATKGLLREVSVDWLEWHLGSYGCVSRDDYTVSPWRDAVSTTLKAEE